MIAGRLAAGADTIAHDAEQEAHPMVRVGFPGGWFAAREAG